MYIRQNSDPHKINYYWWYQNRRMPEAKCLWTHWDLVLLHDLGNGKEYPVRLWRCYTIFHKKLTPNFAARWHVNQKRRACHLPLKDLKISRPRSPEIGGNWSVLLDTKLYQYTITDNLTWGRRTKAMLGVVDTKDLLASCDRLFLPLNQNLHWWQVDITDQRTKWKVATVVRITWYWPRSENIPLIFDFLGIFLKLYAF